MKKLVCDSLEGIQRIPWIPQLRSYKQNKWGNQELTRVLSSLTCLESMILSYFLWTWVSDFSQQTNFINDIPSPPHFLRSRSLIIFINYKYLFGQLEDSTPSSVNKFLQNGHTASNLLVRLLNACECRCLVDRKERNQLFKLSI